MLQEKLLIAEKRIQEIKELQGKVQDLINERKLKFAEIGINEVVKTISELMILEKIIDSINIAVEIDEDEIEVLGIEALRNEVPTADEMLGYISVRYKDMLSEECTTIKRFIESVQFQTVTERLFN